MNKAEFAELFKQRTKKFAVEVILFCENLKHTEASRIIVRQLMRSATSVGANYRAACRARSKAEFYSKLSIVIEEADESAYWLELLGEFDSLKFNEDKRRALLNEVIEIVKVLSTARKNLKK